MIDKNFWFVHRVEDVERRPLFLQIKLFCYNILIIKKYFIFLNDYFISFLLAFKEDSQKYFEKFIDLIFKYIKENTYYILYS